MKDVNRVHVGPRVLGDNLVQVDGAGLMPFPGFGRASRRAVPQGVVWWARPMWAVLHAMSGQVNEGRLGAFDVADGLDMTLGELAMAFKDTDTGVIGDAFEWAVLRAIRDADDIVVSHILDAIRVTDPAFRASKPTAVMVALDKAQIGSILAETGSDAAVRNPRVGRPQLLKSVLRDATLANWKADLLIGDPGGHWVPLTLKSNPAHLRTFDPTTSGLLHPPKVGITIRTGPLRSKSHWEPHITRNPHGLVIVSLPADRGAYWGMKRVLDILVSSRTRDFRPGAYSSFERPDERNTATFLEERLGVKVRDVCAELIDMDQYSDDLAWPVVGENVRIVWEPIAEGESVAPIRGTVIATNMLDRPVRSSAR